MVIAQNYNDIYIPKNNRTTKFLKKTKSIPIYKSTIWQIIILLIYLKNSFGPNFFESEFL
jgi:hypothetical protein